MFLKIHPNYLISFLNALKEIGVVPKVYRASEMYKKGDYNNVDTVKKYLNTPYFHCEFTTTLREFDHWGIATFSKYPIINQGK